MAVQYVFKSILLLNFIILIKTSRNNGEIRDTNEQSPVDWKTPILAMANNENGNLRDFYYEYVDVKSVDWDTNTRYMNTILTRIWKALKGQVNKYPEILLMDFIKQGSAREGLRVYKADEFDIMLPFQFKTIQTIVRTHKDGNIPAGHAEVEITNISTDLLNYYPGLCKYRQSLDIKSSSPQCFLNSKYLHERVFKQLVDKAIKDIDRTLEASADSKSVTFNISRRATAPTFILEVVVITERSGGNVTLSNMSFDVVPAFKVETVPVSSSKSITAYAVVRWVQKSQGYNLKTNISDYETLWRVSYSEFETFFLENLANDKTLSFPITACRILKGIQVKDQLDHSSSQLKSKLKSFHIKTILFYCLLYMEELQSSPSSVTESFVYLLEMLKMALQKESLPHFFHGNQLFQKHFPHLSGSNGTKMDLFKELHTETLNQIRHNLKRVLKKTGLNVEADHYHFEEHLKLFEDHITEL